MRQWNVQCSSSDKMGKCLVYHWVFIRVPFCSISPPTVLPLAAFDRPGQIMPAKLTAAKWTDGRAAGQSEGSVRVHQIQVVFFLPWFQPPSMSYPWQSAGRSSEARRRELLSEFQSSFASPRPASRSIVTTHRITQMNRVALSTYRQISKLH